jgi:Predicted O-methyltransferase
MDKKIFLGENERIDDLNFDGYKIIQNSQKFCFGVDSVLLCNFARIKKNDYVIDFGCGSGVICILLATKTSLKKIVGLEIQKDMVDLARKNVLINSLESKIEIVHGDIKNICVGNEKFDVVVTNPPYMSGGIINKNQSKAIARHEIFCNLEDVIYSASKILKNSGRFFMIHRSQRLADIFYLMRKHNLEPKILQMVHSFINCPAQMVLIEGIKNSKSMLKVMPPLIIYDENGNYTNQINKIYGVDKNKLK